MDVFIPRDRFSQQPRGFGFVTFHDRRDAEDAEEACNE
jgi:RNA recognition motif-containing protein